MPALGNDDLSARLRAVCLTADEIDETLAALRVVLESGSLSNGEMVARLEAEFAKAHGARYAVAVSSGTDALEAILRSIDVSGAEVILPSNTFAATAFAVLRAGAVPVFVDLDPATLSPGYADYAAAISGRTKALIVVHIGGYISPDIPKVAELAASRGLTLVEDASHAHGARLGREAAGSWGAAAAFSMYATKVLTSAEGGLVLTNLESINEACLVYRDQGRSDLRPELQVAVGTNARMSELNAALGMATVSRLDMYLENRGRVAVWYNELLEGISDIERFRPAGDVHASHYKYIASLSPEIDRTRLRGIMKESGTPLAGGVYDVPLHQQPVFSRNDLETSTFDRTVDFCSRHVALPISPRMRQHDAALVVENLAKAMSRVKGEVRCVSQ